MNWSLRTFRTALQIALITLLGADFRVSLIHCKVLLEEVRNLRQFSVSSLVALLLDILFLDSFRSLIYCNALICKSHKPRP